MEIIDTVTADCLEVGDTISLAGYEIEIVGTPETDPEDAEFILVKGHNLTTGDVEPYKMHFLDRIDILGA